MSKEIMIDGVDVSGCDFLVKEDDYCSYSGNTYAYKGECGCSDGEMCKQHPNCFYKKPLKQLQRLKKENEELKFKNHYFETANGELLQENNDLKQKNEELRDLYNKNVTRSNEVGDKCHNYKQTLKDIKEIAEETIMQKYTDLATAYQARESTVEVCIASFEQILAKIKDVIDE